MYRNLPRWWIVWMMRKLSSWLVRARPGRVRLIPYWSILHLNRNISTNPNSNDFDPNALFNGIFRIIRCGSKVNLCVICVAFFNFSKTCEFFDFFIFFIRVKFWPVLFSDFSLIKIIFTVTKQFFCYFISLFNYKKIFN